MLVREIRRCVLDVCYDFMSVCVRKGGSPRYLRARPACHRRMDAVSVFRASESGNLPRDITRLCFIEVSLTRAPLKQLPQHKSSLCTSLPV